MLSCRPSWNMVRWFLAHQAEVGMAKTAECSKVARRIHGQLFAVSTVGPGALIFS